MLSHERIESVDHHLYVDFVDDFLRDIKNNTRNCSGAAFRSPCAIGTNVIHDVVPTYLMIKRFLSYSDIHVVPLAISIYLIQVFDLPIDPWPGISFISDSYIFSGVCNRCAPIITVDEEMHA